MMWVVNALVDVVVVVASVVVVAFRPTNWLPLFFVFVIRSRMTKNPWVLRAAVAVVVAVDVVAAVAAAVAEDFPFLGRCSSPLWGKCGRIRNRRCCCCRCCCCFGVSRILLFSASFDGVVVVLVLLLAKVVVVVLQPNIVVAVVDAMIAAVVVVVLLLVSRSLRYSAQLLWMKSESVVVWFSARIFLSAMTRIPRPTTIDCHSRVLWRTPPPPTPLFLLLVTAVSAAAVSFRRVASCR